jgi:hypothetical protein
MQASGGKPREEAAVPMIVIQHPVADFQAWKKAFDSDPLGRARSGVTRHTIYRAADDPNYVVVNLEFASLEHAQKYMPALRALWGRVGDKMGFGGTGPQARILDETESVNY